MYIVRLWLMFTLTLFIQCGIAAAELSFETIRVDKDSALFQDWPTRQTGRTNDFYLEQSPKLYLEGPIHGSYCYAVVLTGMLELGDTDRFRSFLEKKDVRPSMEVLDEALNIDRDMVNRCFWWDFEAASNSAEPTYLALLNFSGGNLQEGLSLMKELEGFTTVVPANAKCLSACAMAFLGGRYVRNHRNVERSDFIPGRSNWLHVSATLGFHAPQPQLDADGQPTDKNLLDQYWFSFRQADEFLNALRWQMDDTVDDLVLSMANNNEFHIVNSVGEAIRFNLDVYGYSYRSKHNVFDFFQMCKNVWDWHMEPIEILMFPEVGHFVLPKENTNIRNRRFDYDKGDDAFDDYWYFENLTGRVEIEYWEGNARYAGERECSVEPVRVEWKKNTRLFRVEVSSFGNDDSTEVHIIPEWYMQSDSFPLSAMEFIQND